MRNFRWSWSKRLTDKGRDIRRKRIDERYEKSSALKYKPHNDNKSIKNIGTCLTTTFNEISFLFNEVLKLKFNYNLIIRAYSFRT